MLFKLRDNADNEVLRWGEKDEKQRKNGSQYTYRYQLKWTNMIREFDFAST